MSNVFKELLKKVGSGKHTTDNLTRAEAAAATKMMLLEEATPTQIGAFLIAHRIKRPTDEELAGMLDAYDELAPKLRAMDRPPMIFGIPYDGRTRTLPMMAITALVLATAGQSVVMHGGHRLPTKYGFSLVEMWQGLGVDWSVLELSKIEEIFERTGMGVVCIPKHFPIIQSLWGYREQIGKRPPLATMELVWCPYGGNAHIVAGFVHPPTEAILQGALALRKVEKFTLVKGLEGSCDLPRDRTAIIALSKTPDTMERLFLSPHDYGFAGNNMIIGTTAEILAQMQEILDAKPGESMQTAVWNGGFYLWRSGLCSDISSGLAAAETLLTSGAVAHKLREIQQAHS